MKGTVALEKPELWPGGDRCEFTRADVVAFGKIFRYGDFVRRFLVRLTDGRILFIKTREQSEEDQRWFSKLGRDMAIRDRMHMGGSYATRDNPTVVRWMEIAP